MANYMMNPGNYPVNLNLTEYQKQALIQMLANSGQNQNQQPQQWGTGGMPQNNASQGFPPQGQGQGQPLEFKGVFVDNFEQAKGYPVPLGGSCIMMDKNNLRLYIKQVDGDCNPAYTRYRLVLDEGHINTQAQTQQIQAPVAPVENIDQQSQSNENKGEQMVKELLDTIKQLKENQITLTDRVDKAFGIVDNRLKQLEGSSDT